MISNILSFVRHRKAGNKVVNVGAPDHQIQNFSLQYLIKYILIVAQCFALLPVNGITKNVKSLKFEWLSFRTIYALVMTFLLFLYSIFMTFYALSNGSNFFSFVEVMWAVQACAGLIIFLNLARKWPHLLQEWNDMEMKMAPYGPLPNLKWKFKILPIVFLIAGIVNYVVLVYGTTKMAISETREAKDTVRSYFTALYEPFFKTFEYSLWKALIVEIIGLTINFVWQFSDLTVILLSAALAERFQQITNKVVNYESLTEAQWRDIRKHYNMLHLLCKTLNDSISGVVLLSFFGDVYFLAIAIYECFTSRTKFEAIYFSYVLIFDLFHFITICYYASWVHEESVEPITSVSSVSTKNMSHEVDRLLHQMAARDIGIYGGGLFKVTRSVFLNVASILVTLQLILVQFDTNMATSIKI